MENLPRQPTAEQQAQFVRQLQRVLTQGQFVNTYKYALLLALSRWALEHPSHDERAPIDAGDLATYFIELYWPHVQPHAVGSPGADSRIVAEPMPPFRSHRDDDWAGVLTQDRGGQIPSVLKRIRELQAQGVTHPHHLTDAQRAGLHRNVRRTIISMPLPRLQRVRDAAEPIAFLYRLDDSKGHIDHFLPWSRYRRNLGHNLARSMHEPVPQVRTIRAQARKATAEAQAWPWPRRAFCQGVRGANGRRRRPPDAA
ncbi:MAG TPA: hypothetical protein ENI87_13495, partial [bacterium]|nr:hypothetical protein [bacterium]